MKRKVLSADGLISILKKNFSSFSDSRGSKIKIKLEDAFLTAFAAFSLKYDSFNSFFDDLDKSESKRVSVQHLFQVKDVPSATRLKEIIDPIPSEYLRPAFNDIFRELQRGKVLEKYQFLGKHYILAIDGTQTFQSDKIHCKKCLVKEHRNGKLSYSHQMLAGCIVHPLMKQVIPVAPEPIQVQELCCKTFQQVLVEVKRKKYLWKKLLSKFEEFTIKTDWHGPFMTILNPFKMEINSC